MPRELPAADENGSLDTTVDAKPVGFGGPTTRRVPVLTIASHPDIARVGDEVVLDGLITGRRPFELSRLEPGFREPGGSRLTPLGIRAVSRSPLTIARAGDALVFETEATTHIRINGTLLDRRLALPSSALEGGVILELAHRVVLLLHVRARLTTGRSGDLGMVGASEAAASLRDAIRRVADLAIPVLVRGASGTGKELVARALARHRPNGDAAPFVDVNMAAINPSTAASELFGHVRGAFTGAAAPRDGHFKKAHGGTLFLDEVGETPLDLQGALLRVIEEGTVLPVGATHPIRVDVRLVSATDADLEAEIAAGKFKAPLYHRLARHVIHVPPLRDRRDDIPRLFVHFLKAALEATGEAFKLEPSEEPWLPPELIVQLLGFDFPGNIRQLRNIAERIAVANRDRDVFVMPAEVTNLLGASVAREGRVDGLELGEPPASHPSAPAELTERHVHVVLERHGWQVRPAARELGIAPNTLYQLMARSSLLRRAKDIDAAAILDALGAHGGDEAATAATLHLSHRALRQRMRDLGIE